MVALFGTSLITTALGAINTLLPIVIRPITLAPGEMTTLFPIVGEPLLELLLRTLPIVTPWNIVIFSPMLQPLFITILEKWPNISPSSIFVLRQILVMLMNPEKQFHKEVYR